MLKLSLVTSLVLVHWVPLAQAGDSRCPQGMNSPNGSVCVPGEGMYDEVRAIQSRPPSYLPARDPAIDRLRAIVEDRTEALIGYAKMISVLICK